MDIYCQVSGKRDLREVQGKLITKGYTKTYGMDYLERCKPTSTPIDPNHKLHKAEDTIVNREMYQHLVGRLIYLSYTRPDIVYVTSVISQFMHSPKKVHLKINRVLQGLKGSPRKGILFKRNSRLVLKAYTDANYVGFVVDRRSLVARSSVKAKFRAMVQGVCKLPC